MSLFFKRVEKHAICFFKVILNAFVRFPVEIKLIMTLSRYNIIFRITFGNNTVVTVVIIHRGMSVSTFFNNFSYFKIFMRRCGGLLLVVVFENFFGFDDFILAFNFLKNLPFMLNIFMLKKEITLSGRFFLDSLRINIEARLNNSVRLFIGLIITQSVRRS